MSSFTNTQAILKQGSEKSWKVLCNCYGGVWGQDKSLHSLKKEKKQSDLGTDRQINSKRYGNKICKNAASAGSRMKGRLDWICSEIRCLVNCREMHNCSKFKLPLFTGLQPSLQIMQMNECWKTALVGLWFCYDESDNKWRRRGWRNLYIKNTFSAKHCAIVQYVKYTITPLFRKYCSCILLIEKYFIKDLPWWVTQKTNTRGKKYYTVSA